VRDLEGTISILLVIEICDMLGVLFFISMHEKISISDIICITS